MWGSSWDFFSLHECFSRPLPLQDCFSLSRPLHDLFACLSVCLFVFFWRGRGYNCLLPQLLGLFTWSEGGPANRATRVGLTSHTFL